jgi:hypothetical protein
MLGVTTAGAILLHQITGNLTSRKENLGAVSPL